ncbi:MAG: 8-amino-7-oxononanoate synthase [Pseudarcicella sp.]|nr:8-amino-7-oxononanoate synthase [Pseudarcicella sp.]MBP6411019.1 8-amino-7-oxononanoate synthase [Pseudarcicella sp.]
MEKVKQFINNSLQTRAEQSLLRSLSLSENLIDFCSNDYLGFAKKNISVKDFTFQNQQFLSVNGSGGSRLLAGNSAFAVNLEQKIANFHGFESALIFNSGYDANVGLLSSLLQKNDIVITDQYIHASTIDGIKMSHATRYKFRHNDLQDLEKKLSIAPVQSTLYVCVESVYSMDGDMAPLKEISELCRKFGAALIVDEAHAIGVFGENGQGLVHELGLQKEVFACVMTYGKAMGCHGAAVLGGERLQAFLINFARSFIYSTALPIHALACIEWAYDSLVNDTIDKEKLHDLIGFFNDEMQQYQTINHIESKSAIQCIVIPGNESCKKMAQFLQQKGFDIRAVLSPTVPAQMERLRICLHSYNTKLEIANLLQIIHQNL